jgi:redox-sensitive bicupin YhaK (pirin superfamily)
MLHRDSLGSVQRIEPGAINWMTAGRGIVHSERAPEDLRGTSYGIHGLQLWAALPKAFEETDPAFFHTPAAALPTWSQPGIRARVLIGNANGRESPVKDVVDNDLCRCGGRTGKRAELPVDRDSERAVYSVDRRCSSMAARCLSSRWPSCLVAPM